MIPPPLVRAGLLSHSLGDQVLVYDTARERVHLLDATTAKVLELLTSGASEASIAHSLDALAGSNGADLLRLALGELYKADLLVSNRHRTLELPEVTRRAALQRLATAGAALLVPAIISLTPSPASAQSVACPSICASNTDCSGVNAACLCCGTGKNACPVKHTCARIPANTTDGGQPCCQ